MMSTATQQPLFQFRPQYQQYHQQYWNNAPLAAGAMEVETNVPVSPAGRKRKAEGKVDNSERLAKRVSLLNLEQNGTRLYVPVEAPPRPSPFHAGGGQQPLPSTPTPPGRRSPRPGSRSSPRHSLSRSSPAPRATVTAAGEDDMRLDDTPHKVYIYDLDAELASSSDSESDSSQLVFLPDIEKHLRATRIPRPVLADDRDQYAGQNMQLVLYGAPTSLSVPEEKDSVRRAIIEARERAREERDKVQERIKEAQEKVKGFGVSRGEDFAAGSGSAYGPGMSLNLNGVAAETLANSQVDDGAMDLD